MVADAQTQSHNWINRLKNFLVQLGDSFHLISENEEKVKQVNLKGHTDRIYAVAITPDQQYILSASGDRTVKMWHLETGCREELVGYQGGE